MSDEELIQLKSELSEEELNKVLKKNYKFLVPQIGELTATVIEMEEALETNDIEKVLFDKNMEDKDKNMYMTYYISSYLAYRLNTSVSAIHGANSEEEAIELVNTAMIKYLDEYLEYDTFIGRFVVQRRDIPLLCKAYVNAVLVLIYLIGYNWFTDWFIGNDIMFFIGTFLNVMMIWTIGNIALRVWGISYNGKNS